MMHENRRWGVGPVASPEALAHMLTERTWTLCAGFYVVGHPDYLFLNDATSEDGAGEYGVIRGGLGAAQHVQIESITFSWCEYLEALALIRQVLAGEMDGNRFGGLGRSIRLRLETVKEHGRCHRCA